jgi:glucose-1-phosphate thymidylyltransferase
MIGNLHTEILGVLLLGGKGTRVNSLTGGINKHFLEVKGKSLAELGINYLLAIGINNIAVVMHPEDEHVFDKRLAPYRNFCRYFKRILQDGPIGTGHALELATMESRFSQVVMMFADNIFSDPQPITDISVRQEKIKLYITPTETPQHFSVVTHDCDGFVQNIEYKSVNPKSNLAVTGLMQFDDEALSRLSWINAQTNGVKDIMNLVVDMVSRQNVVCTEVIGEWLDATIDVNAIDKANKFILKYPMMV